MRRKNKHLWRTRAFDRGMVEKIALGANKIGTNSEVNMAIKLYRLLEASQKKDWASFTECYAAPAKIVGRTAGKGDGS